MRCYQPSHLYFDDSMENEDIMEWVHLEPPERVPTSTTYERGLPYNKKRTEITKEKKEENQDNSTTIDNLYTQIDSLKSENIRLRQQIRCLKFRLRQRASQRKRKMQKNDKQKKKELKKMIDEQDLHPVAKAMIKL